MYERLIGENDTIRYILTLHRDAYEGEAVKAARAGNLFALNYLLGQLDTIDMTSLLCACHDESAAEVVLRSVHYRVPRRLNGILSVIENLTVLRYLLTHDVACFNIAFRQWQCVRYAVQDDDIARVKCFVECCSSIDPTCRAPSTDNMNCFELAYENKNEEMVRLLFGMNNNFPLRETIRNTKAYNFVQNVRNRICREVTNARYEGSQLRRRGEHIPISVLQKAFPGVYDMGILRSLADSSFT